MAGSGATYRRLIYRLVALILDVLTAGPPIRVLARLARVESDTKLGKDNQALIRMVLVFGIIALILTSLRISGGIEWTTPVWAFPAILLLGAFLFVLCWLALLFAGRSGIQLD